MRLWTGFLLLISATIAWSNDDNQTRVKRQGVVIGRACSQSVDCGSSGAYCDSSKRCRCLTSYTDINEFCWKKINPDESGCQYSQQCSSVWPGSFCSSGTCRCANNQPGFLTRDGVVCVNYGQCPVNGAYTQLPDFTCGTGIPITDNLCIETYDCICVSSDCTTTTGSLAHRGICCPSRALACIQKQDSGGGSGGTGFSTRYFHNPVTGNCETFTYFGSGGNANNFESLEQCESYCKDYCPRGNPLYGNQQVIGVASKQQITYCTRSSGTTTFCSNNNYECKQVGTQDICCPTVARVCSPAGGLIYRFGTPSTAFDPGETIPGRPISRENRWYYNEGTRQCATFSYTGWGGNFNNFLTQDHCETYCAKRLCDGGRPLTDGRGNNRDCGSGCPTGYACRNSVCCPDADTVCKQPQSAGACFQFTKRWWYNAAAGQCEEFDFTGCQGNDNNFATYDDCADFCQDVSAGGSCPQGDAYKDSSGNTLICAGSQATTTTCPTNYICSYDGNNYACCPTQSYTCSLSSSSGTSCLGTSVSRWYYSSTTRSCQTFTYFGCGGNSNNFATQTDCNDYCQTGGCPYGGQPFTQSNGAYLSCSSGGSTCPADYLCSTITLNIGTTEQRGTYCCPTRASVCNSPRLDGSQCLSQSVDRWYFNSVTKTCQQFQFRGCNGNRNNFATRAQCINYCNSADCPQGQIALLDGASQTGTTGTLLTRCTVGSSCPNSQYTCIASNVFGGGICCGSNAQVGTCQAGLSAWIDGFTLQPKTCTPNIGDCPGGYQCMYSPSLFQYYCCGTPAENVCPNGGAPYNYPGTSQPYPCLPTQPNSCSSIGQSGYTCQASTVNINGIQSVRGTCCGAATVNTVCGSGYSPINDFTGNPSRCHPISSPNCPTPSTCRLSPQQPGNYYCCEQTGTPVSVCPSGYSQLEFNGNPVICNSGQQSSNCLPPYICQLSSLNNLYYCCQPGGSTGGLCPNSNQTPIGTCSPQVSNSCQSYGPNYFCSFVNNRYSCCPSGTTQAPPSDPCPTPYRSPPAGRQSCSAPGNCAQGFYCVSTVQGNYCCGLAVTSANCNDGSQPLTTASCSAQGLNTGCPTGYTCEFTTAASRLQCCRAAQQQTDPFGCPPGRTASLYPGTQFPLSCSAGSSACPNQGQCLPSARYSSNICCQ